MDIFEKAIDGLPAPTKDYKLEVMEAELEELHHSIDIKEEENDPPLEYQQDSDEGTLWHSNDHSQIKTEEIELNLEHLDHNYCINIQEKTLGHFWKTKTNCKRVIPEISNSKPGNKPFICGVCGYKCAPKENLRAHLRNHVTEQMHTGEKLFNCTLCDYKFVDRYRLVNHIRTHTGEKPFKCANCDYKCINRSSLVNHIRTHTGEKPFKCTICDYKCMNRSSLVYHKRTHTGKKPFKCAICDCKFVVRSSLVRHVKIHTDA